MNALVDRLCIYRHIEIIINYKEKSLSSGWIQCVSYTKPITQLTQACATVPLQMHSICKSIANI